jgi:pilus assembly protein CpaC
MSWGQVQLGELVTYFRDGRRRPAREARPARRAWLAAAIFVAVAGLWPPSLQVSRANEQVVEIGVSRKSAAVRIITGKSENLRTDRSFSDVIVSDADIADVVPLTDRSMSLLGKKIGTTRVSVYGEGKSLIGVFDVEVSYDTSVLATELRERFPGAQFRVTSVNGRIMLSGIAADAVTVDKAVTIAKQFGPEVINTVKILQAQQVMLEVRFVEASRSASRDLGINWNAVGRNAAAALGTGGLVSGAVPFGVIVGRILGSGVQVDVMIQALEERGVVRRLAEPNLIALSGDTASFLAGGEFPIPVASSNNTVTVEWKKFGVGLAFTPTVLDNGVINLKVEPEVSQLDPNNVVQIGAVRIPSLTVRRANTTIELRDGQSFAIAGLLQSMTTTDQNQLPWIADVPIIGALLRSASFQKQETDLAIIITPHLVRPARPGDAIRTPLENSVNGNDADLFLLGRAEVTPRQVRENSPIVRASRPMGHIIDLPKGAPYAAN